MHQTVIEFFLRPGGSVTNSRFAMSKEIAHMRIATTCLRYLIVLAASTVNGQHRSPQVHLWELQHFEGYVQLLDEWPLLNYALSYVKDHLCKLSGFPSRGHLLSQLLICLTDSNPASYMLQGWLNQSHSGGTSNEIASKFRDICLWFAAKIGLSQVVDTILTAGAHVETYYQNKTPLIIAAEGGNDATVQLLLDRRADIASLTKNKLRQTALHNAASNGRETTVRLLLDRGANIEALKFHGWTALHNAAFNGHNSTVRLLLDRGANIQFATNKGETALHNAASNGYESTTRLLLNRGAKTHSEAFAGTALHYAAFNGHQSTVRLLLDRGADIQSETRTRQSTALHFAALNGHESTVRLFLDRGADFQFKTGCNQTALHIAAFHGHESTVRLLLDRSANIQFKRATRSKALHNATSIGHEPTVLDRGAYIESRDYIGRTALHIAAFKEYLAIVKLLLDYGANIEAKNYVVWAELSVNMPNGCSVPSEWPALQVAAVRGYEAIIQMLIDRGADIEAQNSNGWTALFVAVLGGHEGTVRLLLNHGADLHSRDFGGRTVFQLSGKGDIVRLLHSYAAL